MRQDILVTGGSGTLGRAVVARLDVLGEHPRVLSRRPRPADTSAGTGWAVGDLDTGAGLDDALDGVRAIVHCATAQSSRDSAQTRRLIDAARRHGSPHLVYISIVGIDRVGIGYYRAKLATERLIENSGLGFSTLRTTQFHDLVLTILRVLGTSPVMPVLSGTRIQSVEVREVAERLVKLALGEPAGRVPDMGGPQVRTMRELAEEYLHATRRRRLLLPIRLPGGIGRALRDGENTTPGHADGTRTFTEFLADELAGAR